MPVLRQSLDAWYTPGYGEVLRRELEALGTAALPLQQGLAHSSVVTERQPRVIILSSSDDEKSVTTRVGVFFTGIIAGCSCADDPTPVDELQEYCEMLVKIDKHTACAMISLADAVPGQAGQETV